MIKSVEAAHAPQPLGAYSQAVACGPWIFVSAQLGIDPKSGRLVADDLERQTAQALDNIAAILLAAGAEWHHVARVEMFLIDLRDLEVANLIYGERVQGMVQPARQVMQVVKLPQRGRIGISCIAYKH